jgi:hypothetical protein
MVSSPSRPLGGDTSSITITPIHLPYKTLFFHIFALIKDRDSFF